METRFGEFAFDPGRRLLLRGGEVVSIAPKAFQLLEILIASRPDAVAKKDLYDALWPDTIVDEGNLKNLIAELRAALGDSAKNPRFIRTASRFGYAFASDSGVTRILVVYQQDVFPLGDGEHVIGRSYEASVPIDSPLISRQHARIVITNGIAMVEDLDSKNGTFVNGERINGPRVLQAGDEIRLSDVVALRVRMPKAGDSTMTNP